MNIAVLGTGMVGRTLAARLHELGHRVVDGTRDPQATLARTAPDRMGNPPFSTWHADHQDVPLATFAEAAAGAELVVHASSGGAALEVLGLAGAENLAGKTLVDVSNPLDPSAGFPPTLFVKDTDSLGEQVQRAFPEARCNPRRRLQPGVACPYDPGLTLVPSVVSCPACPSSPPSPISSAPSANGAPTTGSRRISPCV